MKRITAFIFYFIPMFSIAQQGFTVTMHIKGLGENKVKVNYVKSNGKYGVDTLTKQSDDLVVWKGNLDEPQIIQVAVMDSTLALKVGKAVMMPPTILMVLTNAEIQIDADAKEYYKGTVKSKNRDVQLYEKIRQDDIAGFLQIWDYQKEQNRKMVIKDTVGNGEIAKKIAVLRKANQAGRIKFVDEHPESFASLLVLQSLFLILPINETDIKFNYIKEEYRKSKTGEALALKIESNRKTGFGKPVIPFVQKGIDGKDIDIAAMKGKVILVDFWGSWCGPCRQSHPALKKLYEKYHSKGFEIIGIANELIVRPDKKEQDESWRKAIKDDGINWLHILYDPEVVDLVKNFDINGYPTKFLIDQDGKFVMRILGNSDQIHKELEAKIESLLK
ncbi:MAG: TlpA disulfide reductase family protein [Bacteroidetes bacterium]|nr:TlpA disulfide reductase family protein [Bacteroidota bacterium]